MMMLLYRVKVSTFITQTHTCKQKQAYYVSIFAWQLQGSTKYNIFGRDNNSCNDFVWRNMPLFVGVCGYECCQFKSQQKPQMLVL